MNYPTVETINLFTEILKRDGMEEITENILLRGKDVRMHPILSFFKIAITQMLEDNLFDEVDGYSTGFMTCLDLFRRQMDAEKITLEELEIQIENMCGWTEFLEREALDMKNEINELKRQNKELREMFPVQNDGDNPGPT
jgi:hypothetical protein